MSCILYKFENGKPVQERVKATDVAYLLVNGYSSTPEQLVKTKEASTDELPKAKPVRARVSRAPIKTPTKSD